MADGKCSSNVGSKRSRREDEENKESCHNNKRIRQLQEKGEEFVADRVVKVVKENFSEAVKEKNDEIEEICERVAKVQKYLDVLRHYVALNLYAWGNVDPKDKSKQNEQFNHPTLLRHRGIPTNYSDRLPTSEKISEDVSPLQEKKAEPGTNSLNIKLKRSRPPASTSTVSNRLPVSDGAITPNGSDRSASVEEINKYQVSPSKEISQGRKSIFRKRLRVLIGNTYQYLKDNVEDDNHFDFKWRVYVKGDPEDHLPLTHFVSHVVFILDKSYAPNDVITVKKPPFTLCRCGWGEFKLFAKLFFRDSRNKPVQIMHPLTLGRRNDHLSYTGLWRLGKESWYDIWISDGDSINVECQESKESKPVDQATMISNLLEKGIKTETLFSDNEGNVTLSHMSEDKTSNPSKVLPCFDRDINQFASVHSSDDDDNMDQSKYLPCLVPDISTNSLSSPYNRNSQNNCDISDSFRKIKCIMPNNEMENGITNVNKSVSKFTSLNKNDLNLNSKKNDKPRPKLYLKKNDGSVVELKISLKSNGLKLPSNTPCSKSSETLPPSNFKNLPDNKLTNSQTKSKKDIDALNNKSQVQNKSFSLKCNAKILNHNDSTKPTQLNNSITTNITSKNQNNKLSNSQTKSKKDIDALNNKSQVQNTCNTKILNHNDSTKSTLLNNPITTNITNKNQNNNSQKQNICSSRNINNVKPLQDLNLTKPALSVNSNITTKNQINDKFALIWYQNNTNNLKPTDLKTTPIQNIQKQSVSYMKLDQAAPNCYLILTMNGKIFPEGLNIDKISVKNLSSKKMKKTKSKLNISSNRVSLNDDGAADEDFEPIFKYSTFKDWKSKFRKERIHNSPEEIIRSWMRILPLFNEESLHVSAAPLSAGNSTADSESLSSVLRLQSGTFPGCWPHGSALSREGFLNMSVGQQRALELWRAREIRDELLEIDPVFAKQWSVVRIAHWARKNGYTPYLSLLDLNVFSKRVARQHCLQTPSLSYLTVFDPRKLDAQTPSGTSQPELKPQLQSDDVVLDVESVQESKLKAPEEVGSNFVETAKDSVSGVSENPVRISTIWTSQSSFLTPLLSKYSIDLGPEHVEPGITADVARGVLWKASLCFMEDLLRCSFAEANSIPTSIDDSEQTNNKDDHAAPAVQPFDSIKPEPDPGFDPRKPGVEAVIPTGQNHENFDSKFRGLSRNSSFSEFGSGFGHTGKFSLKEPDDVSLVSIKADHVLKALLNGRRQFQMLTGFDLGKYNNCNNSLPCHNYPP